MKTLQRLFLIILVWMCFPVPEAANNIVTVSKGCGGGELGLKGTSTNLNVDISFEGCATTQGYRSLIRDDTGKVLLELSYDVTTQDVVVKIDGIQLSDQVAHTPEEVSRMENVMMSKAIVSAGSRLYPNLLVYPATFNETY